MMAEDKEQKMDQTNSTLISVFEALHGSVTLEV